MATVKEGWTPPPAPYENLKMTAHDVDGEWYLHYCDPISGCLEDPVFEWPFVEEMAFADDLKRIGFEIE